MSKHKTDFIEWCFKHLNRTEDKYELGILLWKYLSLDIHRLETKVSRLEKLLAAPTKPIKKRTK